MFDNNNEFSNLIINSSIYDKTNIIAKMNNNKIIFISDKDYEYLVLSFKTISNSTNSSQFKIFINNDLLYSDSNKSSFTKTVHLNNIKKGDKVEIYFENLLRISSFDLRSINMDSLCEYYKTLTEQRLENVSFKNNTYTSNIKCQNDNSLLVLTIPYNKYLNAYVDGKKIEIEPIFDKAFCSLILNEGEHDIVILYKNNLPFYFIPLSIMSLLILLILYKKNKSST